MKAAILCGMTLIAVAPVLAQSGASQAAAGQANANTVTLTGCVGGGSSTATPITLTNALIVPGTPQPGGLDQTPSPIPPASSSPTTQPDPTRPPMTATASPAAPATQSPVGTSGSKTPATTGTSGGVATPTAGGVGTSSGSGAGTATGSGVGTATGSGVGTPTASGVGTATGSGVGTATGAGVGTAAGGSVGTAPAAGVPVTGTAPAGSSGASVSGYQLSGVDMQPWIGKRVQVVGTWAPAPTGSATPGTTPMREFQVQSVQPATGPCSR
jgi:hypothetical protein